MGLLNSKLPNRFLLENAPEHLKFIGLIAVNHAHLDRKLCQAFFAAGWIGFARREDIFRTVANACPRAWRI
jgi:hypothetical protein